MELRGLRMKLRGQRGKPTTHPISTEVKNCYEKTRELNSKTQDLVITGYNSLWVATAQQG